jgi:hypothetical protein
LRGPTAGLHLAVAGAIAVLGLSFLLDPCGGGGDLCLGGSLGLAAVLLYSGGGTVGLVALGSLVVLGAGVPGSILAAREVVGHRIERWLAAAVFLALALLPDGAGVVVAVMGLVALAAGWLVARTEAPWSTRITSR